MCASSSDEVGAGSPARRHRRDRLHLCRRACLVAHCPGRGAGLRHSGRDHRDDRPGRGRRDLPRHRGAAPAVDPGAGREPVQRRRGDRDLLAGCRDAGRRPAREPVGRARSPLRASSAVVSPSAMSPVGRSPLFIPTLRASRLAEATLTIAFAYVIFVVCDHYLGVSGVVAVAAAALAVSAGGRRRLVAVELGKPRRHLGAAGLLGEFADLSVCGDADPRASRKGELGRSGLAGRAGRRGSPRSGGDACTG